LGLPDSTAGRLVRFSGHVAEVATPEEAKLIVERNSAIQPRLMPRLGFARCPKWRKCTICAHGESVLLVGAGLDHANYLTFRGLVKYGYKDDARALAEKTILLLGRDYEKYGALHEYYLPENGERVLNKDSRIGITSFSI